MALKLWNIRAGSSRYHGAMLLAAVTVIQCLSLLVTLQIVEAGEFQPPQDIVFRSRHDGTDQRYVLMLPHSWNTQGKHDLMIALHGHGSDRWQFARDERDECRAARDVAAAAGMIYVCPDYRAKTSWMGPAASGDMLQILDDLQQQYALGRVIVCGGSMGGSSALAFATLHPDRVHGVVSFNGTANMLTYEGFAEAIAQSYGGSKQERPEIYRERSAELFSERLKMPIATTTGGKDTLVPPDSTLHLMEMLKARGRTTLSIHRADGGHSTKLADAKAALEFVLNH